MSHQDPSCSLEGPLVKLEVEDGGGGLYVTHRVTSFKLEGGGNPFPQYGKGLPIVYPLGDHIPHYMWGGGIAPLQHYVGGGGGGGGRALG